MINILELDMLVAGAEGIDSRKLITEDGAVYLVSDKGERTHYSPSTNWAQGGKIIERERIAAYWDDSVDSWGATASVQPMSKDQDGCGCVIAAWDDERVFLSDTPLVAAMRCFVYRKLGKVF